MLAESPNSTEVRGFLEQVPVEKGGGRHVLRVAEEPNQIMLVTVGGVGIKSTFVQTWGGSTRSVTRVIDEN